MKAIAKKKFSILNKFMHGFDAPSVWAKYSSLAVKLNAVNMGQGFPDWKVPQFLLDNLTAEINNPKANHQYTRASGALPLVQAVSDLMSESFQRKINPLTEISINAGGAATIYCYLTSILNPGDEAIVFEPFYPLYYPLISFAGATFRGIPFIPPKPRDSSLYKNIISKKPDFSDDWQIDFKALQETINDKTKLIILNSPHNPTGKVFTSEEYKELTAILKKYPKIQILSDEVYEKIHFQNSFPRFVAESGLWDRTVTLLSLGKTFSSTGMRLGIGIGPDKLINYIKTRYQNTTFCDYEPIQLAYAKSLRQAENEKYLNFSNYYAYLKNHYEEHRNYTIENFAKNNVFNCNFFLPQGSYFLICDISHLDVAQKYNFENENAKLTKDHAFLLNLAHEKRIIGIPGSEFYCPEHQHIGQNFVRFAFCKQKSTIDNFINNLKT